MHSVCILIYVSMYLYSYLSRYGISGLAARGDWEKFEMRLRMTIEWTQRYTLRPWLSKFWHALGGLDRVNSDMHSKLWSRESFGGRDPVNSEMRCEAEIDWTHRCTCGPLWGKCGDELCGCDGASLEMHLWRPWSSEQRDALRGCYRASVEMHLQAMIDRDRRWSLCKLSMGGALGAYETLLISLLTRNCGNVTMWLYLCSSYGELAGGSQSVGRHAGSWGYIQGLTHHRENEGMTDNLRYLLHPV